MVTLDHAREVLGNHVEVSNEELNFLLIHLAGIARMSVTNCKMNPTVVSKDQEALCREPFSTSVSAPPTKSTTTPSKSRRRSAGVTANDKDSSSTGSFVKKASRPRP